MDKLLPCPFCGGEAETFEASEDSFSILCPGCGVETPYLPYLTEAIAAWNRRIELDAVPVVRGAWIQKSIEQTETLALCSKCSYPISWWHKSNYCPNCGCKMEDKP